jgi:hypothetical protein
MSLAERFRAPDSYGLLLWLIFCSTVTVGAGRWAVARMISVALFGGTLLFALYTSRARRQTLRLAGVLVVLAVALAPAATIVRTGPVEQTTVSILSALLVLSALFAIVRRLASHPVVSGSTILGALCLYLLIGMFFACMFEAIGGVGTFFTHGDGTSAEYLYFSFVTMTTVGYGDLAAAGDVPRLLAASEALVGQLYLVSVVALVVGNLGRERRRRDA